MKEIPRGNLAFGSESNGVDLSDAQQSAIASGNCMRLLAVAGIRARANPQAPVGAIP